MTERLQFSPDILRHLGEELVPDVDQGIVELIKNSYDADATKCEVELEQVTSKHGKVIIHDDGNGMLHDDVRMGWLVIGKSQKKEKSLTTRYGRVPVGDKGLGRLAALRLGNRVLLRTRAISTPGKEIVLEINWEKYENAKFVEEVSLETIVRDTDQDHGTDIEICNIRTAITRIATDKLARSILLLSDPFSGALDESKTRSQVLLGRKANPSTTKCSFDPGFKATLSVPEFADLGIKVRDSYFRDAEYRLHVELRSDLYAVSKVYDWKDEIIWETVSDRRYHTTLFRFDLWVFILDGKTFSTRKSSLREVKTWLSHVGGIHIYENGIRVPPYGGSGVDWLDLNLRRARSPEVRPSTNTSVGRVQLENEAGLLIQKTDRVGYIENEAFQELRECCSDALEWTARQKLREREHKKDAKKKKQRDKSALAREKLYRTLSSKIPDTQRKPIEKAIEKIVSETSNENIALREELQLYRSLATAGMTSAVFAHEIGRPLTIIDRAAEAIRRKVPKEVRDFVQRKLSLLLGMKDRLGAFVAVPLNILAKEKRRPGKIDVFDCIGRLLCLLSPITEHMHVDVINDLRGEKIFVMGSEALLDGIFVNLITNSINAFTRDGNAQTQRRIKLTRDYDGEFLIIRVTDNAGGIEGIDIEDIWIPGQTTTPNGTGFGLTIVKDSVTDLGGYVNAYSKTEFGGAEFEIRLPMNQELL